MRKKRIRDLLNVTTNVLVIGIAAYVVLEPQGRIRIAFKDMRHAAAQRRVISEEWTALAGIGGRVDDGKTPVVLIEFGDYECPFCAQMDRELANALYEDSPGGVVYRHLPLSELHPAAEGAARSAICAEAQGHFRGMHRRLFETDQWKRDRKWTREAEVVGVPDVRAFEQCLHSQQTTARLEADIALAEQLGIKGTPAFVHQRGIRMGIIPTDELRMLLELPDQR